MPDPRSKKGDRWTANRKISVVLELLKGSNAVELARSNGISKNELFRWRDRFLEAGKSKPKVKRRKDPSDEQIGRLERKIGQLTLQVEILQEVARLKKRGGSIERTIHINGLP